MTVAPTRPRATTNAAQPLASSAEARRRAQAQHRAHVETMLADTEPRDDDNALERMLRARRRRAALALQQQIPVLPTVLVPVPRVAPAPERVQTILDRLGDGWWVLDRIAVGDRGAVIDHLVIGPGGVFTVAGHHHDDNAVLVEGESLAVDGQRQPYVRAAQHEAQRATKLLSAVLGRPVAVQPVVAVVTTRFTVRAQPVGVVVMQARSVPRWLGLQAPVLTEADVLAVVTAARNPSTWRGARPGR